MPCTDGHCAPAEVHFREFQLFDSGIQHRSGDATVALLLLVAGKELCHLAEFRVAGGDQFFDRAFLQLREMFLQSVIEQRGGGFVIEVGAAFGFGDDAVDAAQFGQVFGR